MDNSYPIDDEDQQQRLMYHQVEAPKTVVGGTYQTARFTMQTILAILPLALAVAATASSAAERLKGYGVDVAQTSVSGVSSGGYMAVQFHVANSSVVKGAGVLAGGPYYCAQGSFWVAYYNCMTPGTWSPLPDPAMLKGITERLAATQRIDPTANLTDARVWLFTGRRDRTVSAAVVDALRRHYGQHVRAVALAYVDSVDAGHAMITTDFGAACSTTGPPFINDCDYDAAGALLQHIYGPLNPPASEGSGKIIAFDQREFAGGDASSISMGDSGFAYVPRVCEAERCRVHIAFHGCRQSAQSIGEVFVRHAGYNRWSDTNRFIVLYPQTISRYGWGFESRWTFIFNPRGCWDWWGYTGGDYHTREAPQIKAVKAMLERLGQPPE